MRARTLAGVMTAGGVIGLAASFVLAVEKIALLKDPGYQPSCSINPVLSCGSVMVTPQAEAFGFPNPLLGIAGFAALTVLGVLSFSQAFPRWVWLTAQAIVTAAVLFVHWLIYQSLYEIGALCPYCMVVWVVTITVFWYLTLRTLAEATPWGRKLATFHTAGLALWFVVIIVLIAIRFWYFWSTMLS